jgi:signal peptidase II
MKPSFMVRWVAILLVLAATAGCDQATKHFARSRFSAAEPRVLAAGLMEFTLAENPGAFLSLGETLPPVLRGGILTVGTSLGLIALLTYLLRGDNLNVLPFFGLLLAWAGGVSNLIDRLWRHGTVTDFMIVRAGPLHTGVFNIADMAILAGILIVIISTLVRHRCKQGTEAKSL